MCTEQHTRCQFVSESCIYSTYMLNYKEEFSSAPHTVCQEICEDPSTHPLQKQHLPVLRPFHLGCMERICSFLEENDAKAPRAGSRGRFSRSVLAQHC